MNNRLNSEISLEKLRNVEIIEKDFRVPKEYRNSDSNDYLQYELAYIIAILCGRKTPSGKSDFGTYAKAFSVRFVQNEKAKYDNGKLINREKTSAFDNISNKYKSLFDLFNKYKIKNNIKNVNVKDVLAEISRVSEEWYKNSQIITQLFFNDKINYKDKDGISEDMNKRDEIISLIENDVKQIVLTGAPGTGKTYIAKEIAQELGTVLYTIENEKGKQEEIKYEFVQFHPSYDYTDFVEGLRPVEVEDSKGDKQVTFKKVDGIFKAFCRKVVEEDKYDNKYFFIIDEINRADLSKVLGELMFGLEKDKRGNKNIIKTQYHSLKKTFDIEKNKELSKEEDIFAEGLYIPENIIIIGTMNDIDRSVESMDFALRRRFTWIEVEVNKDNLIDVFESKYKDEENKEIYNFFPFLPEDKHEDVAEEIANRIDSLNKKIESEGKKYSLNSGYYISQGYFKDINLEFNGDEAVSQIVEKIIDYVWEYRLKSLIFEYVRGEYDADDFLEKCKRAFYNLTS